MKRATLLFLTLITGFAGLAQTHIRMPISGKVILPLQEDLSGISILNLNTYKGAITDVEGNFNINVANRDSINVSSVQFKPFTVIVDSTVIDSRTMFIYISQIINELPEVVVSSNKLTGNLSADIKTLNVVTFPQKLTVEARDLYADYGNDYKDTRPVNRAMISNHTHMVDGLNFVNLFKLLLVNSKEKEVSNPYATNSKNISPTQIRQMYNDEFFRDNLDIKLDNIGDFVDYADKNGLNEQMLQNGNELDLIQFLIEESKRYKKMKAKE